MAERRLRVGFIGGGLNSAVGLTHRIAAEMDKRWEVVAGCFSTHADINHKTGETWGIIGDRIYDTWEGMISRERDRLDAIIVLTPTPTHAGIVIKVLEEGYHVICEKALASTVDDARDIHNAVQKYKAFFAVTYNYSGYPMLRQLKLFIDEGRLGKIIQIHVEMPQEGFIRLNREGKPIIPQKWRLKDGNIPTISLDLGVHLHQLVSFLTGARPLEVVGVQESFGSFNQICDNVSAIVRYTKDISCRMWYTKSALGHRNGLRVQIYGSEGAAQWYQMDPEIIYMDDRHGNKTVVDRTSESTGLAAELRYNRFKAGHPAGFLEAFANYYYDIADAFIEYTQKGSHSSPWIFGADIALEGLLLFDAIAASARDKGWKKVSSIK